MPTKSITLLFFLIFCFDFKGALNQISLLTLKLDLVLKLPKTLTWNEQILIIPASQRITDYHTSEAA